MRVNLRALGLAFLAAFAMSAVVASSASAVEQAEFTTANGEYPAVMHGVEEGTENFFETTPGRKTECTDTYQATLSEPSTTLTVTPHYASCTFSGVATTFDLNGCHYIFHAGTTTTTTDVHGTVTVKCPPGKDITVTVGPGICTVHVPPQTVGGVTFTNEPANAETPKPFVTVDVNAPIKYVETDTPSSFFCPFTSHTIEGTGLFRSTVRVKVYEDLGNVAGSTTEGTTDYLRGAEIGGHVK